MLKIHLVRHGETSYNAEGNRYCGLTNVDLTPKGFRQATLLAALVKDIDFEEVYCSPLTRAKKTAETAVPNYKVQIDQRLIEMNFGAWEGKTRKEFIEEDPEAWNAWNRDPERNPAGGNGESAGQLIARLDSFMEDLLRKHKTGNVLIVAHNAVNRFLIARLLGLPLKNYRKIVQENSSLTILGYDEVEGYALLKLNCRS